jgi:polysaccharide biosynthesis protein PslH
LAKILTIIPYNFYPPINGGSLRSFYILKEMAKENEVFLITVQPVEDFYKKEQPGFPTNVRIISTSESKPYQSVFNILHSKFADAINYRFINKRLTGRANSYFLKTYPVLLKSLQEINPDIVYYENLEALIFFSPIVRKTLPETRQLYDAHNVDSVLWKQIAIAQKKPEFEKYAAVALKAEKKLYKYTNAVFYCSEIDKKKLQQLNNNKLRGWVIPNGVDTKAKIFDYNPEKHLNNEILFCGNLDYYPNEEGLMWFYNNIFPLVKLKIPAIKLTILGTSKQNKNFKLLSLDSSVMFEGIVPDVLPFYRRASLSIAPLLSGSGTRLKILEAMSLGVPVLSTSIGAEGINYTNGKNIIIADSVAEFVNKLAAIINNIVDIDSISKQARNLIDEEYSWDFIGNDVQKKLQRFILF